MLLLTQTLNGSINVALHAAGCTINAMRLAADFVCCCADLRLTLVLGVESPVAKINIKQELCSKDCYT